jgi:AraC-like DNA-binding protein
MSRFEKFDPSGALKPYVKYFAVSEDEHGGSYKVLPDTSLVMGFQYKGKLSLISGDTPGILSSYGVTGLQDQYRIFKSSAAVGSILVYFNDIGASYFFRNPANRLFSESISLDNFICMSRLNQIHEQLCEAQSDIKRIVIVENFLLSLLKLNDIDQLVKNALLLIYEAKGNIRMKHLAEQVHITQSPLEKRFRAAIGASPKKFASIVKFQAIINGFSSPGSLSDTAYDKGHQDQPHFIKNFRQYSGDAPDDLLSKK